MPDAVSAFVRNSGYLRKWTIAVGIAYLIISRTTVSMYQSQRLNRESAWAAERNRGESA